MICSTLLYLFTLARYEKRRTKLLHLSAFLVSEKSANHRGGEPYVARLRRYAVLVRGGEKGDRLVSLRSLKVCLSRVRATLTPKSANGRRQATREWDHSHDERGKQVIKSSRFYSLRIETVKMFLFCFFLVESSLRLF